MLRNVISSSCVVGYGALKLISWKYTFKRLNEEYEIAKKKQQALDNLYASGKISQAIRDSFNTEISAAIAAIEKQQKELVDGMQLKTQELENQLKTLETLLANYEIQHVAGEIDEEIYQREINLLTTGIETTRNELNVIKQVTNQLSPTAAPIQAPSTPEPAAPTVEAEAAQPAPTEPAPVEVPVVATPVETVVEPNPVETAPAEIPVETVKAEAAPVESAPIEAAPVESTPVETATAPIEPAATETIPAETAPVEPTPVVEAPPVETAPEVAPVETAPVETPTVEIAPAEAAPIAPPEPEAHEINEPAPEIAPQEPTITEKPPQEPIINIETTAPEAAPATEPIAEQPKVEAETVNAAPTEVVPETTPEQPVTKASLQAFDVVPQASPIETKLDTVIEPVIEPRTKPVIAEEAKVQAHPSEAPQAAQTEMEHIQNEDEAATETENSSEEKAD